MRRIATLIVLATAACATTGGDDAPKGPTKLEQASTLMARDRQMSQLSARSGMAASFVEMFDADVITFHNNGPMVGRDAAVAETMRCGESCKLIWEPVAAEADGNLGYTWGTYTWTKTVGPLTETRSTGSYVSIWRKNDKGEWKAVLDMGTRE